MLKFELIRKLSYEGWTYSYKSPLSLTCSFAEVLFPSLSQLQVSLVSFRKIEKGKCLDLPGPLFSSPQLCLEKRIAKQKQFPVFLQCREDRCLQFLKLRESQHCFCFGRPPGVLQTSTDEGRIAGMLQVPVQETSAWAENAYKAWNARGTAPAKLSLVGTSILYLGPRDFFFLIKIFLGLVVVWIMSVAHNCVYRGIEEESKILTWLWEGLGTRFYFWRVKKAGDHDLGGLNNRSLFFHDPGG